MKKALVGIALAAAASGVMAADACTGTTSGTQVDGATDGSKFVRVAFTPKCSANVLLQYTDATTQFNVGAGSKKGKTTFKGSTAGGGVLKSGDCPASGCTATEVGTALSAAAS